ncbi:hypothetical protein AB4Y43_01310 [Paraburkholderia sp. BR10872]|uniref:hypothetical protein n=1 Tax=Paraburkholderia sp. BR10872 TaxID=3236989 RepID=UPI0034D1997C
MIPTFDFQPDGSFNATPTCSTQIAVTTAVQQLTLPASLVQNGTMRLVNNGAQNIAWCYGVNANLSMTNGVLMLANTVESFGFPAGVTQISVIGAATGSTLVASVGVGS